MAKTPTKKAKGEFKAKPGTKPGALRKAEKADVKSDRGIAKKYGVRFAGHKG